jgi:hypothetical protein
MRTGAQRMLVGLLGAVTMARASLAEACAWCLSSAGGDQTSTWPFLVLILVPFLVALAITAVLGWHAGWRPRTLARWLAARITVRAHPLKETKETT